MYVWQSVLTEFAAGRIDADDLWNAVDDFGSTGRLPEPAAVPVHPPDVVDVEEFAMLQEQATRLHELLAAYVAGALARDDLASEALDVLGLADDD